MSLIELSVNRISYSQSRNGAYALILEEIEGERKLPIVIGGFEAQSIAIALDKEIQPPRPLTHDLFKNLANNYEIKIKQVIIHKLVDGIFFSSIICERDKEEEIFEILKRTASILEMNINDEALLEIAGRSRGTPRIANRVLKRVRDFAQVKKVKEVRLEDAQSSLDNIGIDQNGLEAMDRKTTIICQWSIASIKGTYINLIKTDNAAIFGIRAKKLVTDVGDHS